MADRNAKLLFVYGTLGTASASPMAQYLRCVADCVGTGTVFGRIYLISQARDFCYPALVLEHDSTRSSSTARNTNDDDNNSNDATVHSVVRGEIFRFKGELAESGKIAEAWDRLDAFEGAEYRRVQVNVQRTSGYDIEMAERFVKCNVYEYCANTSSLPLIQSGDFYNRN